MVIKIENQDKKLHLLKMFKFSLLLVFSLCSDVADCQYNNISPLIDISAGLPSNEINDIVKDDAGIVWIATDNGLSRYDGYNFINFNHETHPTIFKEGRITKIHKRGAILYLLCSSDGLVEFNIDKLSFRKLYTANPVAIAFSNDTCVIHFDTDKLLLKVKNKVIFVQKLDFRTKTDLAIYKGKIFISANNRKLVIINPKSPNKRIQILFPANDNVGKFCISKKHGLVMWNGDVVRIFRNKKLVYHPDFINERQITYFGEDEIGRHQFIKKNTIPYFVLEKRKVVGFDYHDRRNILYKSFYRLSESLILIATNQGLIKVYQTPALVREIDDFSLNVDRQILQRRKIIEYQNKRFYIGFPRVLEENKQVISLFSSRNLVGYDGLIFNNELFCTTEGDGLVSFDLQTKKITNHVIKLPGRRVSFQSILKISNFQILLCGGNEMVLYQPKNKTAKAFYLKNGTEIHVAVKSSNSNIIYLGTNRGLVCVHYNENKGFEIIDSGKYTNLDVRDILLREKQHEIWLATYSGVFVLNLKNLQKIHEYSQPNQISNLKVVKLIEDKSKSIWASTYSGITVFNTNDGSIRFINQSHGLKNFEYNNKSACLFSDGKIAFGGLNSFEIIDPQELNGFKYAKNFVISGVETIESDNRKRFSTYQVGQTISFNTGKEAVKIYLANLDYQFGHGYSFQYSLDSKKWFKTDKKNWILISNLTYGDYDLKVRMYNPFGQFVQEKSFVISANTPIYNKAGFLSIVYILVVLFCLLFIYFYFRSLYIKAQTKSRIAMDLHDESGTILTRLLMLSKRENIQEKEKEQLQSGLKEALYNFRTYIDSISRENHTLNDLTDELKDFVTIACSDVNIQVDFKTKSDNDYKIKGELFRDIKLSIYEIVTNCIKHAQADQISIKFLGIDNRLHILVSDTGFCDIEDLESYKGNGIRNIKKRIERNRGNVNYYVLDGASGLNIEISLPLS